MSTASRNRQDQNQDLAQLIENRQNEGHGLHWLKLALMITLPIVMSEIYAIC